MNRPEPKPANANTTVNSPSAKAASSRERPPIAYRHLAAIAVAAALLATLWIAFREEPVPVDIASVALAPMAVTIEEEGIARVRDVYALSAPIAGHLDRTVLEAGDRVIANETIVAAIHPLDPPFLDTRIAAELAAVAEAARTAVAVAEVEREQAAAQRDLAQAEHARAARLAMSDTISESELERATSELRVAEAGHKRTEAGIRLRRAELASAEARLEQPGDTGTAGRAANCCIAIRSPVDGVVLSIAARSEAPVALGAPIAEIGDPADIEVVVDVLSADAVRLVPGATVTIDDWGGDASLQGTVARLEPTAVARVSALGIEERRVDVVIDLDSAPVTLGHGYRVYAEMVVWATKEALQIPVGAVFRDSGDWAVFVVDDETAHLQSVAIGRMSKSHAQILDGLVVDEQVILYPSDRVSDGTAVKQRFDTETD